MVSLENSADLMESADNQMAWITEKLDRIIRSPVDISSLTLADPRLVLDLKVHFCFVQTMYTLFLSEMCEHTYQSLLHYTGNGWQIAV